MLVVTEVAGAAFLAVVLVATVSLAASRVRRLDRLHRRLDAARAALTDALARRAAVAVRVAASAGRAGAGIAAVVPAAGREAADREAADREAADREAAANALSRALAELDRGLLPAPLRAELSDAEQLLVLARRVHNDAVRDTLGLRSLRMVRWFHLAGTAPMPEYFEIVDPGVELGAIRKTILGAPERA